jgi:hypothetical protein
MSGGPYGRGKAPERACLPIGQWPEEDRRLWLPLSSSTAGMRHDRRSLALPRTRKFDPLRSFPIRLEWAVNLRKLP